MTADFGQSFADAGRTNSKRLDVMVIGTSRSRDCAALS